MEYLHENINQNDGPIILTLISNYVFSYYSGMLPGCISLLYDEEQIRFNLETLSQNFNFNWICAEVVGIDFELQLVMLKEHEPVYYDFCSINIGSITKGLEIGGVNEYAIKTRPISQLLTSIYIKEETLLLSDSITAVIVGAGIAGLELAMAFRNRYQKMGKEIEIKLINDKKEDNFLNDLNLLARYNILNELNEQQISIIYGFRCVEVREKELSLENGDIISFDLCIWATGASPPKSLEEMKISKDDLGFIFVKKNSTIFRI